MHIFGSSGDVDCCPSLEDPFTAARLRPFESFDCLVAITIMPPTRCDCQTHAIGEDSGATGDDSHKDSGATGDDSRKTLKCLFIRD